jgi:hypothetical protein
VRAYLAGVDLAGSDLTGAIVEQLSFPDLPGTTDYSPRVSPDGKNLIFVRGQLKPSHHSAIFLLSLDPLSNPALNKPRALTSLQVQLNIYGLSWVNNQQVVYLLDADIKQSKNVTGLYRLSLQDLALKRITTGDFDVVDARFSSHQQWLVASCNINGGWQICRIPSGGGTPKMVAEAGGVSPYSPHHSDFVYFTRQQQGLWRMPLLGGSQELVWQDFPEHSWKNWVLYENQLYYLSHDGHSQQAKLMRRDLISNEIRVIYQGFIQWDETSFDISPDGSELFYLRWLGPVTIFMPKRCILACLINNSLKP